MSADKNDLDSIMEGQKLCNLKHPIYDIMGSLTRRELLRLISCEQNYGNQLAKLLDVSNPTVHRHLKKFLDEGMIVENKRTSKSYSGYRGGEAILYTIENNLNMFLFVLPHLVHSHIIELNEDGTIQPNYSSRTIPYQANIGSDTDNIKKYGQHSDELKQLNREILSLETELTRKLMEKNNLMEKIDTILEDSRLNFVNRIILRAMACLGPNCYDDIENLLNEDPVMIDHYLTNLADKGWIIDRSEKEII